jgi:hypothetical protein
MKTYIVHILASAIFGLLTVNAQDLDLGLFPNLPDPLVMENGQKVESVADWELIRRPEILNIFRDSIYGRSPKPDEYKCVFSVKSVTPIANKTAVRKMIEFSITGPNGTHTFELPVYIPKSDKKVPIFILMSHRARIADTINTSGNFPINNLLLPRGYAAAVINASDFNEENAATYRIGLLEKFNMNRIYDWKSLSARAFVASRMIDYLETDPDVDATKIAIIGHSRSGKAAMWAGAQDERIALTCANDAGLGGDKLVRNAKGALLEKATRVSSRWWAGKIEDFAGKDTTLSFDWHELVSTIAPRLLATASASKDGNADPNGQFYTLVFAQPVFALYGKAEILWTVNDAPDLSSPTSVVLENGNIHHHMRIGKHDLSLEDWGYYLDFADKMMVNSK